MKGVGPGDMGVMRPPPGRGNCTALLREFMEAPKSMADCGFNGGSCEPMAFFIRPASSTAMRRHLKRVRVCICVHVVCVCVCVCMCVCVCVCVCLWLYLRKPP